MSSLRAFLRKGSFVLLVGVAVVSGLLWRAELELRWGWAGLSWISGFHFSVLGICGLFAAWLYFCTPCLPPKDAFGRSVVAFGGGLFSYFVWDCCCSLVFSRFGGGLEVFGISLVLTMVMIPVSIVLLAWRFHPRFCHGNWILVPFLFLVSFPLSSFFLWMVDHPGETDVIHAIKSGVIFFGFVIAAGVPFLGAEEP